MKNLLAFQPMHAVIDVSTTVEMKVALSDLGLEVNDAIKIGFTHVDRGTVKVYPSGFNAATPLTSYHDHVLSDGKDVVAPKIDGHMEDGEWDQADVYDLVLAVGGTATNLKAYVMNDANYVYVAVTGEIPNNGFVSFNTYKAGAFSPNKVTAPCVDNVGDEFWDTLVETILGSGTFDSHTRIDGSDLIESAIGFDNMGTRKVFIQLIGANGKALRARGCVLAYLSDDEHGNSVVATEPDGAVAVGTDGLLIPILTGSSGSELAKTIFRMVSESDGDIDISIINATLDTFYLVLVLPNGRLVVSDAIEFRI